MGRLRRFMSSAGGRTAGGPMGDGIALRRDRWLSRLDPGGWLAALHPIDPMLLQGQPVGRPCLDYRPDGARVRAACALGVGPAPTGLTALLGNALAPPNVLRGAAAGRWLPVGRRAVYLVREDFRLDGGVEKARFSVVCGVDPGCAALRPVVTAPREAVDHIVEELRVAGADPTGTTAFYRDEDNLVERLIEARGPEAPVHRLRTSDGGFTIWALSAGEGQAVLNLLERSATAVIGDTSLYRALVRLRDHPAIADETRPVVHFFHQRDFGVILASTVRIYPEHADLDRNALVALMHRDHEVREFPLTPGGSHPLRPLLDALRMEGVTRRAVGLVVRGLPIGLLVLLGEGELPQFPEDAVPEAAAEFDAEWVERGIVQRYLPSAVHAPRDVLLDYDESLDLFERDPGAGLAFYLNPPPKRPIPDLVAAGWRLPMGSLQLRPQVPRGLFLHPFVPQERLAGC